MKISFLISAMALCIVRESFCYDIQVGTVLFTKTDLVRKCWTESDKALLRARLIMQDVLPDPRCIDFSKPRAVSIILDYIYACFHIISTSTYGKLQNLMYLALADTVGGYLRAYVLPLAKKSYYAGLITYEDACRVFSFYDQIRDYLKTNGAGWAEPQKIVFKNIKASPLEIVGGNPAACDILYTIEKKGKLHCINAKCCSKSSKLPDLKITETPRQTTTKKDFFQDEMIFTESFPFETSPTLSPKMSEKITAYGTPTISTPSTTTKSNKSDLKDDIKEIEISTDGKNISSSEKLPKRLVNLHLENETLEDIMEETNESRNIRCDCCERKKPKITTPKRIIIPLPILDDECEPHSIAVPFRKRPLRNLWKKTSAFILEHYYVAVLQCLIGRGNTRSDIKNFNSQFHSWLTSQVYPHLEDEKWYPAFGGIFRITETIKRFGAEAKLNEPMSHDIAFMFRKGVGFDFPEGEEKSNAKEKTRDIGDIEYYYPTKIRKYYLFGILVAAGVWFIVICGCAFFCLGAKGNQTDVDKNSESRTAIFDTPPSRKSETCLPEKKAVSFQFLVRFFKKNGERDNCLDESKENKNAFEDLNQRTVAEEKESKKKLTFKKKKDRQTTSKGENVGYLVSDLKKHQKPSWTCGPSFSFEEFQQPKSMATGGGGGPTQRHNAPAHDSSKVVQTLWKNPFLWPANITESKVGVPAELAICHSAGGFSEFENLKKFLTHFFKGFSMKKKSPYKLWSKKERGTGASESISRSVNDSRTSTDKTSSSYLCSGGGPNSSSSTTNCTLHTHLEEKYSSATMEFFENVISRHKLRKNRFKQKSSTKSESDDDSCSSENEY